MNDGFTEEDSKEIAQAIVKKDQLETEERLEEQESEEYMETIFDFHKFTADPKIRKRYNKIQEIDHNWVFANIKPKDEIRIMLHSDLLSDLDVLLPDNKNSSIRSAILRDVFSTLVLSRARDGKAAELFVTQFSNTKTEISGLGKKKGLGDIFSSKKK